MGVLGSVGTIVVSKVITKSDLVIIIGSGFRQRNLIPNTPIIQVNIDGVKLGKSFPIKCGIIGDASEVVQLLIENISSKEPDKDYFGEIYQLKEAYLKELRDEAVDYFIPINPGFLIQGIKRHASKDSLILVDVGDHSYWFYRKYVCEGERTLMSSNMASMAFALPAFLVAKIVYPDKQVICVTSDGGFGMLMADFTTAVRDKLPIKVVIFNDGRLKNIKNSFVRGIQSLVLISLILILHSSQNHVAEEDIVLKTLKNLTKFLKQHLYQVNLR